MVRSGNASSLQRAREGTPLYPTCYARYCFKFEHALSSVARSTDFSSGLKKF